MWKEGGREVWEGGKEEGNREGRRKWNPGFKSQPFHLLIVYPRKLSEPLFPKKEDNNGWNDCSSNSDHTGCMRLPNKWVTFKSLEFV